MWLHPNTPYLFTDSWDRVGYDENKMVETDTNYYMTYLDLYGYNHVIKYDKSFNVVADKKLNKVSDNHGQLDMQIDINGKLHIIGGGHADGLNYYYLEKVKGGFDFYENKISKNITYPKLYCKGSDMYLYCRESVVEKTNQDRWILLKSNITTQVIDFSTFEQITETTLGATLAGYGQMTLFNGDEFALTCNWYDGTADKSSKGFFIKKNLISGKWYDINNSEISLPIRTTYSNITGDDFRQSQVAFLNSSYYFFKSELIQNNVTLCKIGTSFIEKNVSLPNTLYVNGLLAINGLLYCLATDKVSGDICIYYSNDEFVTYGKTLVGNCGKTYYWTSCTMNFMSNKIFVRILKDVSNLIVKVIDI